MFRFSTIKEFARRKRTYHIFTRNSSHENVDAPRGPKTDSVQEVNEDVFVAIWKKRCASRHP